MAEADAKPAKRFARMTHEDLGGVLKRAVEWSAGNEAGNVVVRLVAEIFRLRQRVRLQRRQIVELEQFLDAMAGPPESSLPPGKTTHDA